MSEYLIVLLVVSVGAAAVIIPLLRSGGATHAAQLSSDADIKEAVTNYRSALREGTVCRKCLRANRPGSRYCADCGKELNSQRG